jgi:hypothetical protein
MPLFLCQESNLPKYGQRENKCAVRRLLLKSSGLPDRIKRMAFDRRHFVKSLAAAIAVPPMGPALPSLGRHR